MARIVALRQSLFRYYADPKWADALLEGRLRFWSIGYFRDLEEQGVRGDAMKATRIIGPTEACR